MSKKQLSKIIVLWVLLLFLGSLLRPIIRMDSPLLELLIDLVLYGVASFLLIRAKSALAKTEQPTRPSSSHRALRALQYVAIVFALFVIGSIRGFSFASDPNTTFQVLGFGMGWESTAGLGGIIGLCAGIAVVIILELLRKEE